MVIAAQADEHSPLFPRVTNWDGTRMTHPQSALPGLGGGLHWEEMRATELRDGREMAESKSERECGVLDQAMPGAGPQITPP